MDADDVKIVRARQGDLCPGEPAIGNWMCQPTNRSPGSGYRLMIPFGMSPLAV